MPLSVRKTCFARWRTCTEAPSAHKRLLTGATPKGMVQVAIDLICAVDGEIKFRVCIEIGQWYTQGAGKLLSGFRGGDCANYFQTSLQAPCQRLDHVGGGRT